MFIHVDTLDSEAYFLASGEDPNLVYRPEDYKPHPLSPFSAKTLSADSSVYGTYKDLLKAGLAFSDKTLMVQGGLRYKVGETLQIIIDTRDIFDTKFVQNVLDPNPVDPS